MLTNGVGAYRLESHELGMLNLPHTLCFCILKVQLERFAQIFKCFFVRCTETGHTHNQRLCNMVFALFPYNTLNTLYIHMRMTHREKNYASNA